MAGKDNEPWSPTTREEWVELFADGQGLAASRAEEAAAKAAADKAAAEQAEADKNPPAKIPFAQRLLGNTG